MAYLLVLTGPRQGQRLPLRADATTLGRDANRDIILDDSLVSRDIAEGVSRKHAIITRIGESYFIEDGDGQGNPSRNFTWVNDRKLPFPGRVQLRNDDRIKICGFTCTFQGDVEDSASSVEASLQRESSITSLQAQPAEKLRALLEISNSLGATLEMDVLGPRIIDSLFTIFKQADRGFIVLRDETSGLPMLHTLKTRRAGEEMDARYSSSIVRRCMEKVEAILGDDLPRQFPDSASVGGLPVRSLMCAPLWSQDGKALGAIQIDTRSRSAKFNQDDLRLLLGVANQASIALSNARMHRHLLALQARERDLEVAQEFQISLLPRTLPDVPGYGFHAHYQAAQLVGGDYYDFIQLSGGRLGVLLGDVAGKGVAAALIMARFGAQARVCLESEGDAAAAVTRLNSSVSRAALSDRFVTLAAVVLDPASHEAEVVIAGHPWPLVCRNSTGAVESSGPMDAAGPPVGIDAAHAYQSRRLRLDPGDTLVLFSDGVTDAVDARGRPFRAGGILTVLGAKRGTAREAGERLIEAVNRHSSGCAQMDDITLVCLSRDAG